VKADGADCAPLAPTDAPDSADTVRFKCDAREWATVRVGVAALASVAGPVVDVPGQPPDSRNNAEITLSRSSFRAGEDHCWQRKLSD